MNRDLFLSILAMDSYNRGYGEGLGNLEAVPHVTRLGNATIIQQSDTDSGDPGVDAGFYAIAYDWNGETVISYRGTDNPNPFVSGGDFWNGWVIGGGYAPASQAGLAISFYQSVTGQSVYGPSAGDVVLTGHSLGGGVEIRAVGRREQVLQRDRRSRRLARDRRTPAQPPDSHCRAQQAEQRYACQ